MNVPKVQWNVRFSAICMWNWNSFQKKLSLFHMNLFHHFFRSPRKNISPQQSEKLSPTSRVVFLVDCPNAWPPSPPPPWGIPWDAPMVPQPAAQLAVFRGPKAPQRASQQWMHLFQPGKVSTRLRWKGGGFFQGRFDRRFFVDIQKIPREFLFGQFLGNFGMSERPPESLRSTDGASLKELEKL